MKLRLLYIAMLWIVGMISIDLFHAWADTSDGLSIIFRVMITFSFGWMGYLIGDNG